MSILKSITKGVVPGLLVATCALWVSAGCKSSGSSATAPPSTQPQMAMIVDSASQKSGSQLWGENCGRCHNFRPPQYYSDAQWDLIVHHMRLRAHLTGDEAREITKFLQSSN